MPDERPHYRIGQAASESGLSAASIRFYEKQGLLPPGLRSEASYRLYSEEDVHRLRFIRLCRALDMSLEEVRTLLDLDLRDSADCLRAQVTLDEHLRHVRERLEELRVLVQRLHDAAMRPLAVAAPPDGQQIALQHPQFLQSFANVAQVLVQGDLGA